MIIITGASGALGKELFKHYFDIEGDTIGTYNNSQPEANLKNNLFKVDVSNYMEVESFINSIKDRLNQICLINGAAITYNAFAHKSDTTQWAKVIETNLLGSFHMIRALLPFMRVQEYGRIINISSVVAQKGAIGTSAYAASKAGLWGMTKTLSLENAAKNILVNSINLGYMEIGMTMKIPEEIQSTIKEKIPVKAFGHIDDLIMTIDFLIKSTYITGTEIDVNGGLS